jgi:hypothetical protein
MRLRLDFSATVEMTNAGNAFVPCGNKVKMFGITNCCGNENGEIGAKIENW